MHDKLITYPKYQWPLFLILLLIIINLCLGGGSGSKNGTESGTESTQTIQQLYEITDGLGEMESVMEVLTLHGSVQYYADDENWLYFEQMAGGFRMTLGKNTDDVSYLEYEQNGIRYTCIQETLGSELAWEDEKGYMFYLYSSLDMEHLLYIAGHLAASSGKRGDMTALASCISSKRRKKNPSSADFMNYTVRVCTSVAYPIPVKGLSCRRCCA